MSAMADIVSRARISARLDYIAYLQYGEIQWRRDAYLAVWILTGYLR